MLREAMEEGAFGISSGLDYPPGSYASTDELAALTVRRPSTAASTTPTSVTRWAIASWIPFREAIEIGRRGEGPAHITHFYHRQTSPARRTMLSLVDDARAAGQDVTFDAYPYEWASTRLLIQLPQWVQAGGPMRLKERLAEGATRDRIRTRWRRAARPTPARPAGRTCGWGPSAAPENLRWESRTLADVMEDTGQDAVDAICQLLLSEDLRVAQVTSGPWTDGLRRFLPHPAAMVGTDSTFLGEKPSPRTYGSFPRILGQFVRDEGLLSLEEAVRRMTGAPAARLGLRERGLLRDGFAADVVVFDAATHPRQCYVRRATTISRWDRARHRERRGRGGRRPPYRSAAGAVAAAGTVMTFPTDDVELTTILVVSTWTERATSGATWWAPRSTASTAAPRASCAWPGPGSCWSPAAAPTEDKPEVTFAVAADPSRVDHAFTMRVADCHAAYETLRARGAAFLTPPVSSAWETRAFFRDPDGHLLEISEARSGA